jgi:ketosteroid isomerase-like protein
LATLPSAGAARDSATAAESLLTARKAARPTVEIAAPEAPSPDIAAAVQRWRAAWEGRDADAYANLYHPEAAAPRGRVGNTSLRAPRFTKVSLQARATSLFSQYDRIRVDVGAMAMRRDGDLVVSTFDQDFTAWRVASDESPAYVDHGRRTLVFARGRGSEWRIVSEQWRQVTE